MKRLIGAIMIALPFIFLFVGFGCLHGFDEALIGTLIVTILFLWIMIGVNLTFPKD